MSSMCEWRKKYNYNLNKKKESFASLKQFAAHDPTKFKEYAKHGIKSANVETCFILAWTSE